VAVRGREPTQIDPLTMLMLADVGVRSEDYAYVGPVAKMSMMFGSFLSRSCDRRMLFTRASIALVASSCASGPNASEDGMI
jgi:hypothetical protein